MVFEGAKCEQRQNKAIVVAAIANVIFRGLDEVENSVPEIYDKIRGKC